MDDIHLYGNTWDGTDFEYVDIDLDGTNDFRLSASAVYYSHLNLEYSDALSLCFSNTQIAISDKNDAWLDKRNFNSIINDDLLWSEISVSNIFSAKSSETGTSGLFQGDGYYAFRLLKQDTIYGWMRVFVNCQSGYSFLNAYEYAYLDYHTGINENLSSEISLFYCRIENIITVNISEEKFDTGFSYKIYNASGSRLLAGELTNRSNSIDLNSINNHFLILVITNECGESFTRKIIK